MDIDSVYENKKQGFCFSNKSVTNEPRQVEPLSSCKEWNIQEQRMRGSMADIYSAASI